MYVYSCIFFVKAHNSIKSEYILQFLNFSYKSVLCDISGALIIHHNVKSAILNILAKDLLIL